MAGELTLSRSLSQTDVLPDVQLQSSSHLALQVWIYLLVTLGVNVNKKASRVSCTSMHTGAQYDVGHLSRSNRANLLGRSSFGEGSYSCSLIQTSQQIEMSHL